MSSKVYPVSKSASERTLIDAQRYHKWYEDSVENPDKFWGKHGKRIKAREMLSPGLQAALRGLEIYNAELFARKGPPKRGLPPRRTRRST